MSELFFTFLGSIIQSRIGQMALVALVSWFWSAHNTSVEYERQIAAEKAKIEEAYKAEIQREEYAAREIAEAATRRAEDDLSAARDMQSVIDDYEKKLKGKPDAKVTADNCNIDGEFAGVVRKLSSASNRYTRAAKRSKKLR